MKIIFNYRLVVLFAAVLTAFSVTNSFAQDSTINDNSKWTYYIEPYILFPNMSGTVQLSTLPEVTVDANTNEIFGNLKMGAMLYAEMSNDKWAIGSDIIYMSLAQGLSPGLVIANGEVAAKQFAWEVSGLRRLNPWLEVGAGLLLNSVDAEVTINRNNLIGGGTTLINQSVSKTWVDPMVIARIKNTIGEKFVYQFRGEIGGFGIGSDLAWQMQAVAGYQFTKLFSVTGGYRIISLDYESGSGLGYFNYNIDTAGPIVRIGFSF
jgi:hypothetical protein